MIRNTMILGILVGLGLNTIIYADIIEVPADQPTIQACIDVAVDGDECIVAPGTYNEVIDFHGSAITVRSSDGPEATIIDGTGLDNSVVKCISGEDEYTVLEGFTITGGTGDTNTPFTPGNAQGGGMLNYQSSPTIRNCVFGWNVTEGGGDDGGGMLNAMSSPFIVNSVFVGNTTGNFGGGMYNRNDSNPTVFNCKFIGNVAETHPGGGMATDATSSPHVVNCLFSGNSADGFVGSGGGMATVANAVVVNCVFIGNSAGVVGGGLHTGLGTLTVVNSIFWNNSDAGGTDESAQIHLTSGVLNINHSCVQGWTGLYGGTGNIIDNPLFVDADGFDDIPGTEDDDLRLLPGSPSIDVGNNATFPSDVAPVDLDGNRRFVDDPASGDCWQAPGTCGDPPVVDMGAYEFQGDDDEECEDEDCELEEKVTVCHVPPGNPNNAHIISICAHCIDDHLNHGDCLEWEYDSDSGAYVCD